jgi:hypothetical protein
VSAFSRKAFVFVSSHAGPGLGPVDRGFIAVMAELVALGASVHYIAAHDSPGIDAARAVGARVAPYRLTRANVVRSVSRLRKYLRRLDPVVVHATGHEATVLVRLASRPLSVAVVDTVLSGEWPPQGRNRATSRARRSLDRRTGPQSDVVIVDSDALRGAMVSAGYDASLVVVEPLIAEAFAARTPGSTGADLVGRLVRHHLALYERLIARWEGPSRAKGPKRRMTLRRVRRDVRRAVRGDR